jgi:hypothetical protein
MDVGSMALVICLPVLFMPSRETVAEHALPLQPTITVPRMPVCRPTRFLLV